MCLFNLYKNQSVKTSLCKSTNKTPESYCPWPRNSLADSPCKTTSCSHFFFFLHFKQTRYNVFTLNMYRYDSGVDFFSSNSWQESQKADFPKCRTISLNRQIFNKPVWLERTKEQNIKAWRESAGRIKTEMVWYKNRLPALTHDYIYMILCCLTKQLSAVNSVLRLPGWE